MNPVRRVRVLQLITSLAGGAGLHAMQLAKHLDPKRFEVELAFGPGYPLDAEVQRASFAHHELRWSRAATPLSMALGTLDLWRLLHRRRYDIVHAHCSLAGALGRPMARLARVPRVLFTVHAFASHEAQPALKRQLLLAIERALDRFTDVYCVGTRTFRSQLVQRRIADDSRIEVIPLGIEIGSAPDEGRVQQARARLGLAPGELAIVAAGRFEPQKGLAHLIDAMPQVLAGAPGARLLIFGEGPLRSELEARVAHLGLTQVVRFPGWCSDLVSVLPGAQVFCLSSLWEAFGYVLLEAMAARVAIVATRVGGVPEVLDGGRLGDLVEPADPAALARGLLGLLTDARRRADLAACGRAELEAKYPIALMIGRHQALYECLAAPAFLNRREGAP
jgi:glycosyltransferase involved in cell wall biosynthesis